jgi:2-hydroxychromene-2-carboxylate isomerase
MTMTITAYTDVRSPYTFVAKAEVYQWEEDFGVTVDWWPYAAPLEEVFGPAEGRNERQLRKIKYMYMNVRRVGAAQGLTVRGTKRIFDPTPAHVGLLQARDDGIFRAFHDLVFERVFRRELDPDDPEHAIYRRAEAEGVFGVPSFVLDGELFWGTDTLPQIRQRLSERCA